MVRINKIPSLNTSKTLVSCKYLRILTINVPLGNLSK
jgi:hypothetical protein